MSGVRTPEASQWKVSGAEVYDRATPNPKVISLRPSCVGKSDITADVINRDHRGRADRRRQRSRVGVQDSR